MILSSKSGGTFRETFLELAAKFTRFMDVLSEISEGTKISKDSDLLKLYEKRITNAKPKHASIPAWRAAPKVILPTRS